ncbi:unnamed protein product [Durusdinium trenchii]|uniref:PABS domain-containing protein n=1 Tax=Durusdinium trenchii TaxID=1381693 RepID=A0ABP0LZ70_9DINO
MPGHGGFQPAPPMLSSQPPGATCPSSDALVTCVSWNCLPGSAELYADSYDLLMEPVEDILDEHEHCGWGNPLDLTVKATTSSSFEEFIEMREDDCGNRVLMMGGFLQCHSVDEHLYHEMMVHPAFTAFQLQAGRGPETIFLGGSGDGAGPREVLRWRSVRNVTMVDIDYEVTRFSLEWMPTLSNGSFKDPRLKVVTGDAMAFLQELPEETAFDVLIMDFPDVADSQVLEKLYSEDFYRLCRRHMHAASVLAVQTGPCSQTTRAGYKARCQMLQQSILPNIAKVFQEAEVLLHPMATWKVDRKFPSEWSSFTLARLSSEELDYSREVWREHIDGELRYYSGEKHWAALNHPLPLANHLRELLRKPPKPKAARAANSEL